jgi:pSer/pThr/pTyr-binding forkhead associated (FHA) protein
VVGNKDFPKAFLIIGGSKLFSIDKPVIQIGRSLDNDLVLDYAQISRKHAEIKYSQSFYEITDLESMGGTFVNGDKITNKKLNKGDVITLVNLHLVFGQDDFPDSSSTTQYQIPEDPVSAEKETKSFNGDQTKEEVEKKSGSY